MKNMTKKEQIIATLKCKEGVPIPISPLSISRFEWTKEFPSYKKVIEALDRHGTPFVKTALETKPYLCDPKQTRPRTETKMEGDNEIIRTSITTPKGELFSIAKRNPKVAGSSANEKFMVETEEDVEKLRSLKAYGTFLPDVSGILEKQKEVGDDGLVCVNGIHTPALIVANAFRYEYFLEWAFTTPELLREFAETYNKRVESQLRYFIEKGAGPAFRWYNFEGYTTPMMPPAFADEFIAPYDEKLMKIVHDAGGYVDNHCHGRLRDQVHNFLRLKVDCINCVEPPPANDIDLRELREKTRGKIAFWGYIQWEDMERKSAAEIRRLTREAIEMAGNRGFILSQAASAYASEISEHFSDNLLAMIDEGVKINMERFGDN